VFDARVSRCDLVLDNSGKHDSKTKIVVKLFLKNLIFSTFLEKIIKGDLPLTILIKSISVLVLQSRSKQRSENDGVATYASAENDVNYSVMRVVKKSYEDKVRDTKRKKKIDAYVQSTKMAKGSLL